MDDHIQMDEPETMADYSTMDDAETYVPHHMRGGYQRYFEYGIPPGSFGQAILNLDAETARIRADLINIKHVDTQIAWVKKQFQTTTKKEK